MKLPEKPDARLFREHLKELRTKAWLDEEHRWWTRYLFHFADLSNIVSILKSDELLSRTAAKKQGNFSDSASPDIIEQTDEHWKDYVRFYMRPRTPTLFNNEGFRPLERRKLNSHCPIPVYLLFDFESIISLRDAKFSKGNLARIGTEAFATIEEFQQLPFQQIYHDTWFDKTNKDSIIFHRQAEVIVPKRVDLENLKYIWCRSQAEYETLRYLLPEQVWSKWRNKILTRTDKRLFERKWVYVDQVTLSNKEIIFRFNQCHDKGDTGPFKAKVEINETISGIKYIWQDLVYNISDPNLPIDLSEMKNPDDYTVTLTLDNRLAYKNRFQEYDIPF